MQNKYLRQKKYIPVESRVHFRALFDPTHPSPSSQVFFFYLNDNNYEVSRNRFDAQYRGVQGNWLLSQSDASSDFSSATSALSWVKHGLAVSFASYFTFEPQLPCLQNHLTVPGRAVMTLWNMAWQSANRMARELLLNKRLRMELWTQVSIRPMSIVVVLIFKMKH